MCEYCDLNTFLEWNDGEVTLHQEKGKYIILVRILGREPQEHDMSANYCFNCGKKLFGNTGSVNE